MPMPENRPPQPRVPIGDVLRRQRTEVLGLGLRQTAELLDIAAPHLTDIEKGRRNPSEDLMLRIAKVYKLSEAVLRAGWSRPDTVVAQIASANPVNAELIPAFLRKARNLSPEQWQQLMLQADKMASDKKNAPRK